MKAPTVDDSKPKRDKLGPTGPAKISDDATKKGEESDSAGSEATKEPSYESDIENILDRKRAQTPPGS